MLTKRKLPRRPSLTRNTAKDRELEKLLLLASQHLKPVLSVSVPVSVKAKAAAKGEAHKNIRVA